MFVALPLVVFVHFVLIISLSHAQKLSERDSTIQEQRELIDELQRQIREVCVFSPKNLFTHDNSRSRS